MKGPSGRAVALMRLRHLERAFPVFQAVWEEHGELVDVDRLLFDWALDQIRRGYVPTEPGERCDDPGRAHAVDAILGAYERAWRERAEHAGRVGLAGTLAHCKDRIEAYLAEIEAARATAQERKGR